jgi:competence protein ComGC
MSKLKNKKGFTLVEAIVALEITSIMLIFAISFTIKLNKAKIKNISNYSKNCSFDALCKEIKYNCSYEDAIYLRKSGLIYMQEKSFEMQNILNSNIVELFSDKKYNAIVQLEIEFPEEKNVANIYISLKDDFMENTEITKLISLGDYKWK